MTEEYDKITAFHYAAYRPPLHSMILREHLPASAKYKMGLDVGCGAGHSSIALAKYCEQVIGIDPSREMLDKAITLSNVTYEHIEAGVFGFANDTFDIISLAGSLHYAKSQALLDEVVRSGQKDAKILVYDFEIQLEEFLDLLKVNKKTQRDTADEYDHQADFSGLRQDHIHLINQNKALLSLDITSKELAHLLCSVRANFRSMCSLVGQDNLHLKLDQRLQEVLCSKHTQIKAKTYLSIYKVVK